MKNSFFLKPLSAIALAAIATLTVSAPLSDVAAHCQVPCGIFDDPAALAKLAENAETAHKAVTEMLALADKTDTQSKQQFVRWVTNKESHAADIQQIALDYFLAQRIKAPADESGMEAYNKHLGLLHSIIVHAMKVKQNSDLESVDALTTAIADFTAAYNAK